MVWIFRPPGVSMARANRRRAKASLAASGAGAPVSTIAAVELGVVEAVHVASVLKTRAAMLAAAALVKVRQRTPDGGAPSRSRRSTRWASTWVLPEPALADTQAEEAGFEARCWRQAHRQRNLGPWRARAQRSSPGASSAKPPVADHSFTRARWS